MRMIANVAVDGLVGAVPLIGDAFDALWARISATCGCCGSGLIGKGWCKRVSSGRALCGSLCGSWRRKC